MEQSKYRQHSAGTSHLTTSNGTLLANFTGLCGQFDMENVDTPRHICPVCNKTFRASSLLDIHMRVHVGAKPFVCPVCNHRATQKGNLKLHMKKHHGRDLPTYIDLIPDSGIWGNFSQNASVEEMQMNLANKKKSALAHSSLLNEDVVELIKKCQNNIGQSTMGRITESLKDFLDMAQSKIGSDEKPKESSKPKQHKQIENANSNNNGARAPQSRKDYTSAMGLNAAGAGNAFSSYFDDSTAEQVTATDASGKQFCFCKICGWKTTSAGYLSVHMRKHKAETHVCKICGRGFKETWYLKNHMRSHIHSLTSDVGNLPSENTYNVDPKVAKQEVAFDFEQQEHELNDKKADCFMCSYCGLVFPEQLYEEHLAECGVVKNQKSNCKLREENSEDEKKKYLAILGLTDGMTSQKSLKHIPSFNALIGSFVVHSLGPNESNFKSTLSTNSTVITLKKEIQESMQQHGLEATRNSFNELMKNPSFKMLITPEQIQSIMELLDFKSVPSSTVPQKPSTEEDSLLVDASFSSKSYRNPAMQSLADIGKSLATSSAENCSSGSSLSDIDPQGQGFQCQFCLKWFKYKSVLGIHMRSHTGERPYKCRLCGYAGTQHNCLKLHMQRHHPEEYAMNQSNASAQLNVIADATADIEQEHMLLGQAAKFNPAKCPVCNRVSPSPGYLKIHMRSHKQTLDHVCPICGRGFKEYWYLATHLRTHDQDIGGSLPQTNEKMPLSGQTIDLSLTNRPTPASLTLAKQRSLPESRSSHTQSTSSWSPLNILEDSKATNHHLRIQSQGSESVRQHVSKRKAFQPSRYRAEPYTTDEPMSRSRKSKPRKLSHGSYLAPVFHKLPSYSDSYEDDGKVGYVTAII